MTRYWKFAVLIITIEACSAAGGKAPDARPDVTAIDLAVDLPASDIRPEIAAIDVAIDLRATDIPPEIAAIDLAADLHATDIPPDVAAIDFAVANDLATIETSIAMGDLSFDLDQTDSPSCPEGEAWIQPYMMPGGFTPFCGRPCLTSADCSYLAQDGVCVQLWEVSSRQVCVSSTFPAKRSTPLVVAWDSSLAYCDGSNLMKRYLNTDTGIMGFEVVVCPNGCKLTSDAGAMYKDAMCL